MDTQTEILKTNGANVIFYRRLNPDSPQEILVTKSARGPWVLPGGEVDYSPMEDGNEPYLTAAIREVSEELGLDILEHAPSTELVAICQQRKIFQFGTDPVYKITTIGTVLLYALGLNVNPESLCAQESEVTAIGWWTMDRVLRDTGVGLAYRRMAAIFLEKTRRYHPRPIEVNLGHAVKVECAGEHIII